MGKLKELEAPTATVGHPQIESLKVELVEPEIESALRWFREVSELKEAEARVVKLREILAPHVKAIRGLPVGDGTRDYEAPFDADDMKVLERAQFSIPTTVKLDDGREVPSIERFTDNLVQRLMKAETFSPPLAAGPTPSTSASTSE